MPIDHSALLVYCVNGTTIRWYYVLLLLYDQECQQYQQENILDRPGIECLIPSMVSLWKLVQSNDDCFIDKRTYSRHDTLVFHFYCHNVFKFRCVISVFYSNILNKACWIDNIPFSSMYLFLINTLKFCYREKIIKFLIVELIFIILYICMFWHPILRNHYKYFIMVLSPSLPSQIYCWKFSKKNWAGRSKT